jgi:hypothetical protein
MSYQHLMRMILLDAGDRLAGLQQLSQGVRLQGQDGAVTRPV